MVVDIKCKLTTLEAINIEPKIQFSRSQNVQQYAIVATEPLTKQAAMKLG